MLLRAHTHVCMQAHMALVSYTHLHTWMLLCTHTCMWLGTHPCTLHTCMHVHACLWMHACGCMYLSIHEYVLDRKWPGLLIDRGFKWLSMTGVDSLTLITIMGIFYTTGNYTFSVFTNNVYQMLWTNADTLTLWEENAETVLVMFPSIPNPRTKVPPAPSD